MVQDDRSSQRFEMRVPARLEFLPLVRHAVEASLEANDFPEDAVAKVRLVLSEVVANALEAMGQSSGSGTSTELAVEWSIDDRGVEVAVNDSGGGFDPAAVSPRPDLDPDRSLGPEGGFGLGLIAAFSDELEFAPTAHGTETRFAVRRTPR